MKKLILLILLTPMFCKAQSPYQDLLIPIVDTGNTFLDNFNDDVDSIIFPDTSLIIGTWGNRWSSDVTIIDLEPIVKNIINQNKIAMKKFQYQVEFIKDRGLLFLKDELNRFGKDGWELVYINISNEMYIFKREIIVQ